MVLNDPSDPSDRFDFSSFSSSGIEKIEIYKGSLSSLYGGSAIGGVVYLYSKKLFDRSLKLSAGNYSYSGLALSWGAQFASSALGFIGDYSATKGLSTKCGDSSRLETDPNSNTAFLLSYKKFSEHANHQLLLRSFKKEQDTDNSSSEDAVSYVNFDRKLLAYRWNRGDHQILSSVDFIERDSLLGSYQSEYAAKTMGLSYQWEQFSNLDLDWIHKFEFKTTRAEISGIAEEQSSELFAYASQIVKSKLQSKYSLGFRLDKLSRVDTQYSLSLSQQYYFANFKQGFSVATGFKNPSLYNFYAPTYGNLSLKTEKSKQVELWLESLETASLLWDLRTYYIRLKDLIDLPTSYTEPYENLDEAEIKGLEFSLAKQQKWLDWKVQWTLLETKDLETRESLVGRPDKMLQVSLSKKLGGYGNTLIYKKIGRRKKYSSGESDPYDRVDYYLAKKYSKLELRLRIENLLNTPIESVSGFTSPGRFIKIGLKRSF